MPFPDDFRDDGSVFPSIQRLRDERIGRRAARLGAALGRVDKALDELAFRAGGLATDAEGATDDDLADAEFVAAWLETALAAVRVGPSLSAAERGGWA